MNRRPASPVPTPDVCKRLVRVMDAAYHASVPRTSPEIGVMVRVDLAAWTVSTQMDLMHPDDAPAYRSAMVAFFEGGEERLEFKSRPRVGGAWRWTVNDNLASGMPPAGLRA